VRDLIWRNAPLPGPAHFALHVFMVADANGVAGYQARGDLVVRLNGATNLDRFTATTFV
jgi:hypothetical protein